MGDPLLSASTYGPSEKSSKVSPSAHSGKVCKALVSNIFTHAFLLTENTIAAYLEFFRKNFPQESIPPKMHILEDHVIPFMKKWKVGLGFLGEQGVESVRTRLNNIKDNIRGFNDELAILKSMITTHWIQTRPAALSS